MTNFPAISRDSAPRLSLIAGTMVATASSLTKAAKMETMKISIVQKTMIPDVRWLVCARLCISNTSVGNAMAMTSRISPAMLRASGKVIGSRTPPVKQGVTDPTKRALPAPRLNGRIQATAMATGTGFGHKSSSPARHSPNLKGCADMLKPILS